MRLVRSDSWAPVGINSLEPTADLVVRSNKNILVVAGPGSGKTELLAQRACYLLETGLCPAPGRILAISFKRDAAKNLGDRVRKRCPDKAQRFDSYTVDSFAKGLIDRFSPALPEDWRPKITYEVMLHGLRVVEMREWLAGAGISTDKLNQQTDDQIKRLFDNLTHGQVLPYSEANEKTRGIGLKWWRQQLDQPPGRPSLSFPMLNRLAAYLLRCNPKLTTALRATYGFVFLDEFQDTTAAQYDLIHAAFHESPTVLTAVGDSKQRIMLWAGAMSEVFDAYQVNFLAEIYKLVRNYRSAPELVRMQHVIAQAVESGTPTAEAAKTDSTGSCVLLEFSNPEEEAKHLADLIEQGICDLGKKPRDYCILVRQRSDEMILHLKPALDARGIKLRDESQLQDILAEPVVKFLLAALRLATRPRDAEAWETLTSEISILLGLDETDDATKIEIEAKQLLDAARKMLASENDVERLPSELVSLVGAAAFRSVYRQYGRGTYLNDIVEGLSAALRTSGGTSATARERVDEVIGNNVVPAMTIHKSKGLEFNTVIFLGLEDSQWWAFTQQAEEEKRGFFVAFSRAMEHVYFTFSDVRDGRWGRKRQGKARIGDLYTILRTAGVQTVRL